jgi:hypothetical protein
MKDAHRLKIGKSRGRVHEVFAEFFLVVKVFGGRGGFDCLFINKFYKKFGGRDHFYPSHLPTTGEGRIKYKVMASFSFVFVCLCLLLSLSIPYKFFVCLKSLSICVFSSFLSFSLCFSICFERLRIWIRWWQAISVVPMNFAATKKKTEKTKKTENRFQKTMVKRLLTTLILHWVVNNNII